MAVRKGKALGKNVLVPNRILGANKIRTVNLRSHKIGTPAKSRRRCDEMANATDFKYAASPRSNPPLPSQLTRWVTLWCCGIADTSSVNAVVYEVGARCSQDRARIILSSER